MESTKKKVFMTGATGHMGQAALKEFEARLDRFDLTVLSLDTPRDRKILAPYEGKIRVVWGDLTNYDDVLQAVTGSDIVLHVGGMVSPAADYFPERTMHVNTTAAKNIAQAILSQPETHQPKLAYIGSVAQLGDRNEPVHWGRTGDPIQVSVYDHYAISKTIAERTFVDSGIKKWVCLRQSGILYPEILKNYDPIMFHVPIRGVLEWATVEDSGRVLANLCEDGIPETFWNRFYNIGSGEEYRLSNYEFECLLLEAISCPPPEKIFDANWFVLRNFHGHWYEDSDELDAILHFRSNTPVKAYFNRMSHQVPWYFHLAKLAPAALIKRGMKPMAFKPFWGTQDWIKTNNEDRIRAYYGSLDAYKAIGSWEDFTQTRPSDTPLHLDHGFDESKPFDLLDEDELARAAEFRGGKYVRGSKRGSNFAPAKWQCQFGHEFEASPALVLLGGHWCPECMPMPWNYGAIAKGNPFFAQLWNATHAPDDDRVYTQDIFKDFAANLPK